MTSIANVRRALPDDHQAMLELWERSVRATHDFLSATDIDDLRPQVMQELAGDATEWWVATMDDAVAAFLGYSPGTIDGLFVDPVYRGRGLGSLLIQHAQQLAGGPLRVDVNEQNPAALGFYQSLGFEIVGRSGQDGAGRPFPLVHMARRSQ